MKHLKTLLAVMVTVAFALSAQAQRADYRVTTSTTFTNAAAGGTNIAFVIPTQNQAKVAIHAVLYNAASGGTNALFVEKSLDNSNWYDGQLVSQYAISGTAANNLYTQFDTAGAGYIRVSYATNWYAAGGVTNGIVRAGIKPAAP